MPRPRSDSPRARALQKTVKHYYCLKCAGEGYGQCQAEIFIEGRDYKICERTANTLGWSCSIKDGWLCPECKRLLNGTAHGRVARPVRQKYAHPLTQHEMKVIRDKLGGKMSVIDACKALGIDPAASARDMSRDARVIEMNRQGKRVTERRYINLFEFGDVPQDNFVEELHRAMSNEKFNDLGERS